MSRSSLTAIAIAIGLGVLSALSLPGAARAANFRNHIEAVRRNAPVVYLGEVGEVELYERQPRDRLAARADVRVLFVARSTSGEAPSEVTLEYPTWDDEHPPYAGDGQYRLAPSSLVVVFADSWTEHRIAYLLHGGRNELAEDLRSRRSHLAGMSGEDLERHEIDESDRRVQLQLYWRLVSYLDRAGGD